VKEMDIYLQSEPRCVRDCDTSQNAIRKKLLITFEAINWLTHKPGTRQLGFES
jgi:hypothetical protein